MKRRIRKAVKTVRGYEAQREFYLKVAMPILLSVMFANSLFQINRTWKIVSIHGHNFLHPNLSLRSKILSRYFFFTWGNPAKLSPTLEEVPSSMALIANHENLLIMKIFDIVFFITYCNISKSYPMHIPFIPISQPVKKKITEISEKIKVAITCKVVNFLSLQFT